MSLVYIEGLDRMKVVRALWENSKPAIFFSHNSVLAPQYDETIAEAKIQKHKDGSWDVDFVCGRQCKVTFYENGTMDSKLYDRNVEKKAFDVVDELRVKNQKTN